MNKGRKFAPFSLRSGEMSCADKGAVLRGVFAVCRSGRLGGVFLPIAIPGVPESHHFGCFEGMLLKKCP